MTPLSREPSGVGGGFTAAVHAGIKTEVEKIVAEEAKRAAAEVERRVKDLGALAVLRIAQRASVQMYGQDRLRIEIDLTPWQRTLMPEIPVTTP